eukprot:TRINITY_DN12227_c1_g1_i2.p1 TRINITY_DN12227_c1_g1~~TRINITY_DN12227_c1_g1_i2.p1  ORF type:complete len:855 (+),score=82.18 TRINITY_DN12227_c1_g1_i2:70-2634(+)
MSMNFRRLLVYVVAAAIQMPVASIIKPDLCKSNNLSTAIYELGQSRMLHHQANTECQRIEPLPLQLTSIHALEEQLLLCQSGFCTSESVWLGGRKAPGENWAWLDGSAFTYSNFALSEMERNSFGDLCIAMKGAEGLWFAEDCAAVRFRGLCGLPSCSVTTTSTSSTSSITTSSTSSSGSTSSSISTTTRKTSTSITSSTTSTSTTSSTFSSSSTPSISSTSRTPSTGTTSSAISTTSTTSATSATSATSERPSMRTTGDTIDPSGSGSVLLTFDSAYQSTSTVPSAVTTSSEAKYDDKTGSGQQDFTASVPLTTTATSQSTMTQRIRPSSSSLLSTKLPTASSPTTSSSSSFFLHKVLNTTAEMISSATATVSTQPTSSSAISKIASSSSYMSLSQAQPDTDKTTLSTQRTAQASTASSTDEEPCRQGLFWQIKPQQTGDAFVEGIRPEVCEGQQPAIVPATATLAWTISSEGSSDVPALLVTMSDQDDGNQYTSSDWRCLDSTPPPGWQLRHSDFTLWPKARILTGPAYQRVGKAAWITAQNATSSTTKIWCRSPAARKQPCPSASFWPPDTYPCLQEVDASATTTVDLSPQTRLESSRGNQNVRTGMASSTMWILIVCLAVMFIIACYCLHRGETIWSYYLCKRHQETKSKANMDIVFDSQQPESFAFGAPTTERLVKKQSRHRDFELGVVVDNPLYSQLPHRFKQPSEAKQEYRQAAESFRDNPFYERLITPGKPKPTPTSMPDSHTPSLVAGQEIRILDDSPRAGRTAHDRPRSAIDVPYSLPKRRDRQDEDTSSNSIGASTRPLPPLPTIALSNVKDQREAPRRNSPEPQSFLRKSVAGLPVQKLTSV